MRKILHMVIRCAPPGTVDEMRNVAVLVVLPSEGLVALRHVAIERVLRAEKDEADFIRSWLEMIEHDAARHLADGSFEAWAGGMGRPSDASIQVSEPRIGVANMERPRALEMEVRELLRTYTGMRPSGRSRSRSHQVVKKVLDARSLSEIFRATKITCGPVQLPFQRVGVVGGRTIIIEPKDYDMRSEDAMLEHAYRLMGRVNQVARSRPKLDVLLVAAPPPRESWGPVFDHISNEIRQQGIIVVPPRIKDFGQQLDRLDLANPLRFDASTEAAL